MDGLREFLEAIRQHHLADSHLRGLFHLLIGRKIAKTDGTLISTGLTWRQLAQLLRQSRWEKELVAQLGLDPATLSPRDRERFWYQAINSSQVHSIESREQAERVIPLLAEIGYTIS